MNGVYAIIGRIGPMYSSPGMHRCSFILTGHASKYLRTLIISPGHRRVGRLGGYFASKAKRATSMDNSTDAVTDLTGDRHVRSRRARNMA